MTATTSETLRSGSLSSPHLKVFQCPFYAGSWELSTALIGQKGLFPFLPHSSFQSFLTDYEPFLVRNISTCTPPESDLFFSVYLIARVVAFLVRWGESPPAFPSLLCASLLFLRGLSSITHLSREQQSFSPAFLSPFGLAQSNLHARRAFQLEAPFPLIHFPAFPGILFNVGLGTVEELLLVFFWTLFLGFHRLGQMYCFRRASISPLSLRLSFLSTFENIVILTSRPPYTFPSFVELFILFCTVLTSQVSKKIDRRFVEVSPSSFLNYPSCWSRPFISLRLNKIATV